MIRPNRQSANRINFEAKEKNYRNDLKKKHFCPNDGWVCFRNGELMSGNIAKKTIGDGSKTGLIYVLMKDCGEEHAATFMVGIFISNLLLCYSLSCKQYNLTTLKT